MRKAFSIIEMSIVLVVIGVIIGGILTAQDLIRSAKVSSVVAELTYFNQAKYTFMDQYKFRPGDVPSPYLSQNFTSYAAGSGGCLVAGNLGNGLWDDIKEIDTAWLQLSYADMIKQRISFNQCSVSNGRTPGTHRPASEAGSGVGYTFGNLLYINIDPGGALSGQKVFQHFIRVGTKATSTDNNLDGASFPVYIHRAIDAKIDQPDTPYSGKYIVGDSCIDKSGGAVYFADSETVTCTGNLVEIQN